MTTIYLIRHSKPLKVNNKFNSDNLQIQNEKSSLSIEGEQIAQLKLNNKEFDNIDVLYSSNYVRTIQTAKYLAEKNNLEVNVISDLGERKFGVDFWEELPEKFERKQFLDENYKIGNGESQKEVKKRMSDALNEVLDTYPDKRIVIVTHSTAGYYLLSTWCDGNKDSYELKYDGNIVVSDRMEYCDAVKLEFDGKKLISICKVD